MPVLLVACLAAGLVSAALVRTMIRVAVLDTPAQRSAHDRPTPKGGGVGVMAAFLLGTPLVLWLRAMPLSTGTACLLLASGLLALVCWLDDVWQFRPLLKLSAQAAAACLVLWGIAPLPGGLISGLALGCAWLLFVTNALNFIDGLNGLAAGSMALACLYLGLTAADGTQRTAACLLAAGLLGFLPFNYPRGRIFLGDVGSQGAGLAVAALGLLRWQDGAPGSMPGSMPGSILVTPLLLTGILYDVTFTLCRRWRAGERLTQAHRGHLYQLAFRGGVPAWRVTLVHWAFVFWGGGIAFALGHAALRVPAALLLAALPQLAWTGFVLRTARGASPGRW